MSDIDILDKIHAVAQVHTGKHFVYTGEEHGDGYVDYRPLGKPEHTALLREASMVLLGRCIEHASIDKARPITLVGPETLGVKMIHQIFYAPYPGLGDLKVRIRSFKKVADERKFVWTETDSNAVNSNAQIIWMDDLLNAATTFRQTKQMVEDCGATVHAIAVFGDRSGLSASELGVSHIEALERFTLHRYQANTSPCPLCEKHVPIMLHPGHGHEFRSRYPNYPGGFLDH